MKILSTLWAMLLFSMFAFSQKDPCEPQCNIYFDDILKMRCPDEEIVAKLNNLTVSEYSFNPDYVKLGGPHCGDKAAALLKKFREEDQKLEKVLRGRYCSAQQGWVPDGDCVHGGPPPCCTAPAETRPWKKTDPLQAIQQFKKNQEKIYQQRLREIADIVKPCKIQNVNDNKYDFNNSYEVAIDLLNKFKDDYPSQYTNVQNSHGAKISQLKKQYEAEFSKAENADIQKLNQYVKSIKQEEESLTKLSEQAEKEKDKEKAKIASAKSKNNSDSTKTKTASNQSTYVDPKVLEMQARYQEQRRKDATENVQMGTAMATTGATMLAMSDRELQRKEEDYQIGTYLKAVVGLGWNFIPLISNMNYSNRYVSQEAAESFPLIEASFQFAAFNRSFISWKIAPSGYFGMNAFDAGATGTHFSYGGSTSLGFGKKFKLLLQGEYFKRSGSMTIDNAVNFSDSKGTVNYNYATLKYGPGILLRIGDASSWGGTTEYSLSTFREKLSFLKGQNKDVYSFQFKISAKTCSFFVQYSPDYPASGDALFPNNYIKSKESLMTIAIAVPLTIFYN